MSSHTVVSASRAVTDIEPGFGHWFAGFTDGEGSFLINHRKGWIRKDGTYLWHYVPMFTIALRADDHETLEEIQRRLGGGLYHLRRYSKFKEKLTRPTIKWATGTKADLLLAIETLDLYPLRSKKARDFAIWREAVLLYLSPTRMANGHIDWARLKQLKDDLENVRIYPGETRLPRTPGSTGRTQSVPADIESYECRPATH